MYSSIAPCLSNSAKIASNSAKSVAALTPEIPEVTLQHSYNYTELQKAKELDKLTKEI